MFKLSLVVIGLLPTTPKKPMRHGVGEYAVSYFKTLT